LSALFRKGTGKHRFKFKWWRNSVDENFRPVRISLDEYFGALTNTVSINKIRINHYTVKAYNTFLKKKNRGRATCDRLRSNEYFKKQDRNEIEDKVIFQFLPEIKRWYQKNEEWK